MSKELKKLTYTPRQKTPVYYDWASIVQANREDNGYLSHQGELLLQEYIKKVIEVEVKQTKEIEKENVRLTNLVNHLKEKFSNLSKLKFNSSPLE